MPSSLGVIISRTIFISIPLFLHLWIWQWEKLYHILDADSKHTLLFQRALSQPSWLQHTHCCYDSVFKRFYLFSQTSCIRVENMVRQKDSMSMGSCCTSYTVKWLPWSEAVLCEIPQCWVRDSVSPWVVVLAKALYVGTPRSSSEYVSTPKIAKHCPFHEGIALVWSMCH